MSAWIRSVTGRAYHFEPLNAKQLERPSPFLPELRFLKALGVSWWKTPARGSSCVPIAQSTERECPKLQVAGESPAGDTISGGCGSTAECGRAKAETTVRLRSPAPFWGRSSSAERSFDMREAKRAALFVPTIFEGIAQPARADASHASGQRCKSFCPHHLLSLWCSPANMPASHAGDHRSEAGQGRHFPRRVVYGE